MRNKLGRFERVRAVWDGSYWNDGYLSNKGRFMVYWPDCPRAYSGLGGYALRTHVVWWLATGKCHRKGEDLHHKDENKLNDIFSNLELLTHGNHSVLHNQLAPITGVCRHCKKEFTISRKRGKERTRTVRFCSQKCYHAHPRAKVHLERISAGLAHAYKEGRR